MLTTMKPSVRSLAVLLLLFSGCGPGGALALNYARVAIHTPARGELDEEQVRESIRRALLTNRWQVVLEDRGAFTATYSDGPHAATVRVTYDPQTYSIEHQSSSDGLHFDGTHIHPRYNRWVRELQSQIEAELDRSTQ
jgi:hypothetical protein